MVLAEDLAKQQRSISVAEFFEKNKHLLGFDSPTRGIITTIKEAVDNALDACEEAEVLPDIFVGIKKVDAEVYRITVEDNGPGIVPENVPLVFGKLLYGSRFHQIRQSRGQQGIGISAAVLYAQLTTGTPALVTSRTGAKARAHRFELMIRTETNEPEVLGHEEIDWDRMHGTRLEIQFKSTLAAKKRLLDYLRLTAIVNPHARITADIDGEVTTFERVASEVPPCPKPILPHPHGIEFGALKRIAAASTGTVEEFLIGSFSRVGMKTANEMIALAKLKPSRKAKNLDADELKRLLDAMQGVKVPAPPAQQCLSPIGEDLICRGLEKEIQLDFIRARTRPSAVYGGHSFIIEAAIGYGGKIPPEGSAQIFRFANRVPLLYQQGACAITNCVAQVNWKGYGLSQQGLPMGPALIMVHVASTNVPFTSESKDAVASIPEIEREVILVLQELGRELKAYLSRRDRKKQQDDRARAICSVIPEIAAKVSEIVELPLVDTSPIEGRIMRKVVAKKRTSDGRVHIDVNNYTAKEVALVLYNLSHDAAEDAKPRPDFVDDIDGEYNKVWRCTLGAGEAWQVVYTGAGDGSLDLRGVEDNVKVVVDLDV
ncbi:DNA topoisomerase VI subunit B [Methanoculleus sp. UBA303]|jgi:DNA topoisomerase-6 subunit B|uniref:DNA topoisomerase VI subunit B n=1 Tax=Methanoculleus sp. UBA303 TaxID=1915497 RepID=UPI0025DD640E|nr:DNA topoisomerase VI subunit B [Methanoculleus sp. UBA303]MDD3933778.1 DNA topoisomerase VI subunit B [Methanoculleus sp.]